MRLRNLLVWSLVAAMLVAGLQAFAAGTEEEDEVLVLQYASYITGDTPGGRVTDARIDLFHELYGDRYRIDLEAYP